MARQKLSVVVLTKNEEKNIVQCLDTVKWADEIIVIDDNSTDKTVEVARRYTDKIRSHSLGGDFSSQRNFGNDLATGDWIIQMDADERVGKELREKIEEILEHGSAFSAFRFGRINNFCGKFLKYGGTDSHRPLRLFKRGAGRFSGGRIHEELEVNGPIGDIGPSIEHYNFPDVSHYVSTQNFYTDLEAKAIFERLGIISEKTLRKELTIGPLKLFFKIYFKKRGYKDGLHGLIFAVLSAWRRFLIYAKYWEITNHAAGGAR